jgi:hypothetical protein
VPRHLVVPSTVSKMISEPVVRSAQTMHLSCVKISTISNELSQHPQEPHHLGVPSGASKMISEPMVRSTQTFQVSCVKISIISKELNQASTRAS